MAFFTSSPSETIIPAATVSSLSTPPATLAAAIEAIGAWTELSSERRAVIISSVRLVARSAGLPADSALLTVDFLRAHLLDRSPAALGVSDGRRANAASDLRMVLRRFGMIDAEPDVLAPAWSDLLAPYGARARSPFIRFAKFAMLRGIMPYQVDDASFAAFSDWLATRILVARPKRVAGTFRRAWNAAAEAQPAWPQNRLGSQKTARDEMIQLELFPDTFQADVKLFLERQAGGAPSEVFGADVPPPPASADAEATPLRPTRRRPARPATIRTRRDHLRWAANALVATGVPVEEITSLAALFEPPERPWAILKHMYERAGGKASTNGQHVGEILSMIATHHLGLPQARLEQIKRWRGPLAVKYIAMTPKNDRRLRAVLEPARYLRLMRLPAVIMAEAEGRLADAPRAAVSLALRALAVQILLSLPSLRLGNIVGLRLGDHFQRGDPRRGHITHLLIPAEETKNRRAISVSVPKRLSEMLETWCRQFRPLIAAQGNVFVFPGGADRPITPQGMRDAVREVTHEIVGVAMNPHAFRHLNAVTFLKENPGQYEVARQLLNHADVATTVRHYAGVEQDDAHARFDALNEERQSRALRPGKAAHQKKLRRGGSHGPKH